MTSPTRADAISRAVFNKFSRDESFVYPYTEFVPWNNRIPTP